MQTYTEAESNANLFAWTGFVRRCRETSDFRTRRAKPVMQAVRLALPRREPYLCRRQNIRRSRGRHGLPCRSRELRSIPCWNREASVLCEGGGSATVSRQIGSLSLERNNCIYSTASLRDPCREKWGKVRCTMSDVRSART